MLHSQKRYTPCLNRFHWGLLPLHHRARRTIWHSASWRKSSLGKKKWCWRSLGLQWKHSQLQQTMTEEGREVQTGMLDTNSLPHTLSKILACTNTPTLFLSAISCWSWNAPEVSFKPASFSLFTGPCSASVSHCTQPFAIANSAPHFALPMCCFQPVLIAHHCVVVGSDGCTLRAVSCGLDMPTLDLPHICVWIMSGSSVGTLFCHHCCWSDELQSLIQDFFSSSKEKRPIKSLRVPCMT